MVPDFKSQWSSEENLFQSTYPAYHQPWGSAHTCGSWRTHPPVQPRVVAASVALPPSLTKSHNNINNNILDIVRLGAAQESVGGRRVPMRGRDVYGPLPGHYAAGPRVVGAGLRAGLSEAPDS